jgi:hypothetical protein
MATMLECLSMYCTENTATMVTMAAYKPRKEQTSKPNSFLYIYIQIQRQQQE